MQDGRFTLTGVAKPLSEADKAAAREVFLAKYPNAFYVDFGDFRWFRVEDLTGGRYVGGFGRVASVSVACRVGAGGGGGKRGREWGESGVPGGEVVMLPGVQPAFWHSCCLVHNFPQQLVHMRSMPVAKETYHWPLLCRSVVTEVEVWVRPALCPFCVVLPCSIAPSVCMFIQLCASVHHPSR